MRGQSDWQYRRKAKINERTHQGGGSTTCNVTEATIKTKERGENKVRRMGKPASHPTETNRTSLDEQETVTRVGKRKRETKRMGKKKQD